MENHEICLFENGSASIRNRAHGEAMHSAIGPWQEANQIYIEPSGLLELLKKEYLPPLVLYDIGLGIGANSIAALYAQEESKGLRSIHVISFESDLSGARIALEKGVGTFPFLAGYEEGFRALLTHGKWASREHGQRWTMVAGDFRDADLAALPRPDLIFFDFYSPKVCPELWTTELFKKLRSVSQAETLFQTYSSATAVRAALLIAGFHVGKGGSTLMKLETTQAATLIQELRHPLERDWLEHWDRSPKALPIDASERDRELVLNAPQFLAR